LGRPDKPFALAGGGSVSSMPMAERRFPRSVASLQAIYAFVREFLSSQGIGEDTAFDVDLILEELFTNMVKYGRGGGPEISIALDWTDSTLTLRLKDFGVEPFDPTTAPNVDTERPIAERRAGGLGIHLVRLMADRLEYAYEGRCSTITVTKRLAP
jgi:serine/threonine-protein kinase RsbW